MHTLVTLRDDLRRMVAPADAVLADLGRQADAAYADYFDGKQATDADYDKASDRCKEIVAKMIATPARTLVGLRVKLA
jgi:hypothetical protein